MIMLNIIDIHQLSYNNNGKYCQILSNGRNKFKTEYILPLLVLV